MRNANEADSPHVQEVVEATSQYFSVSTPKFILMSICTLGLYEFYWFYKNWEHVKQRENSKIWPFWRAVFARLNAYFLFERVRQQLKELDISVTLMAGPLAILYFILLGAWRFDDPYWLVGFLTFAPLLAANDAMTEINKKTIENFQQNRLIRGWNWLAVILGGPIVVAAVIGTFLLPEA